MLLAPSALRPISERIHDLDHVDRNRRAGNVDPRARALSGQQRVSPGAGCRSDRPAVDARFDVQVRQSLPFMDFSSAKWEMLVAVRNFFRETAGDQSVYDELLVVRPPKRVVGGVTLRF